ncbi:MAG: AraC family transcriptional regulator [Bacteroidota bacterium]
MTNETQLQRYKRLITYIDERFKEDINIEKVEAISHYSYRNINRIFQALHHETIGKYIKRMRLEKAAQYLKYSKASVSDIAFEVGFEDVAAFSKAFKSKYNCSPSAFRNSSESIRQIIEQSLVLEPEALRPHLQFEISDLPSFDFLCLEYRGDYNDLAAIGARWKQMLNYAQQQQLLNDRSIFLAEILDDNKISEYINCRYNLGILLAQPLDFEPDGLFKQKQHKRQRYAKFLHVGPHEQSQETYTKIYAHWMLDVKLELADAPILEFYLNHEENAPKEELITEILIPVR